MSTAEDTALVDWVRAGTGLDEDHVYFAQQEPDEIPAGPRVTINELTRPTIGVDWLKRERNPLDLADDVIEAVDVGLNTLTLTGHAYVTGDGPVQGVGAALPGGLAENTDYWVIVDGPNTIRLARRFLDAVAATPVAIDLTSAGSGTRTIVTTAESLRRGEEIEYIAGGSRELVISLQCFAGVTAGEVGAPVGASSPRAFLEGLRTKSPLPSVRAPLRGAGLGLSWFGPVRDIGRGLDATIFEPRAQADVVFHVQAEAREYGTIIETAEVDNELSGSSHWVPEAP